MGRQSRTKRERRRGIAPDPITQMMRPACSRCSQPIEWLTVEEATARGIDLGPALGFLDLDKDEQPDIWACTHCSEFGVLGGLHFEGFDGWQGFEDL